MQVHSFYTISGKNTTNFLINHERNKNSVPNSKKLNVLYLFALSISQALPCPIPNRQLLHFPLHLCYTFHEPTQSVGSCADPLLP